MVCAPSFSCPIPSSDTPINSICEYICISRRRCPATLCVGTLPQSSRRNYERVMSLLRKCPWILVVSCLIIFLFAPFAVGTSSGSNHVSTMLSSSIKGGATRSQSSKLQETPMNEGISSGSLFGVHRPLNYTGEESGDDIFFVSKRDGSKEPLKESKVQ